MKLRMQTDSLASNTAAQALITTFAHDLRQPLRSIVMATQRIQRKAPELNEEIKAKLEEILAAARRQEELIASIVEYDQVFQTQPDSPIGLRLAIQTACMKIEAFRQAHRGSIQYDPEAIPRVQAPSGLTRVLEKVLHNSLKFHAPDNTPAIELEASDDCEGQIVVRVSDNGLGVEPQYREVVFEPFKRLNPASEYAGSGIGLATCRRVMETMRGTIRFEDHRNGAGSLIALSFPKGQEPV